MEHPLRASDLISIGETYVSSLTEGSLLITGFLLLLVEPKNGRMASSRLHKELLEGTRISGRAFT